MIADVRYLVTSAWVRGYVPAEPMRFEVSESTVDPADELAVLLELAGRIQIRFNICIFNFKKKDFYHFVGNQIEFFWGTKQAYKLKS